MDFDLDEDQRLLQATVARLMAEEYGAVQRRALLQSGPGFSEVLWKRYAELGLLGLLLPEEFGGSARSFVDAMVVLQAFGRALPLEPFLATVVLGAGIVNDAGSEAQKRAILPAVAAGDCKLALAHGERAARYQLTRVETQARRTAGGWTLQGEKAVVLHGGAADWLIVSARTAGDVAAADGISLFLVPAGAAGLERRDYRTIDGLRASDLMLAEVELPADACLGPVGQATPVLQAAHDRAVAAVCAEAVGSMEALFDATLAHLKSRRQFGAIIGSFQALQHRMADMLVHLEQARSMACLAAMSVEDPEGRARRKRLAAAKIQIGRSGRFIGQQSVQLHGGVGVTDEYFVGHLFKRLTTIDRLFGDVDHHLDRFAEADEMAGERGLMDRAAGAAARGLDIEGLRAAFEPRSIAVIGASSEPTRIGGRPVLGARQWGYEGRIFPVNPRAAEVQGHRAFASIRDIGEPVDLAILALPSASIPDVLEDCAASGVRAAIVFSSGFAEAGPEGKLAQERIAATARRTGLRLIGPNCMGVLNPFKGVFGSFTSTAGDHRPAPSGISLASQSGAFGVHCIALMRQRGLGLGLWGTAGNQADVDVSDILGYMAQAEETKVILGCLEAVPDAGRFRAALALARRNRRPVVLLKIGRSDVGREAAVTHTASLVGSDDVLDAILDEYGVHRAATVDELFDVGYACANGRMPRSNSVGLITVSGGFGIIMADAAREHGLEVPALPAATQDRLRPLVPFAGLRNPLDVTAHFVNDFSIVQPMFDALLEDGGHASLVCYVGATGIVPALMQPLEPVLAAIPSRYPDRVFCLSMISDPELRRIYERYGYLVYEDPARALSSIAALRRFAEGFAEEPPSAPPLPPAPIEAPALPGSVIDEVAAKAILRRYGVPGVAERVAATADAACAAAAEVGYPCVLKLLAPGITHKSDLGGVVLGITDPDGVRRAFDGIMTRVARAAPEQPVEGVIVSPMITDAVEVIVGMKRDPVFGPILLLGLGGIFVEILQSSVLRAAPIGRDQALGMIAQLPGGRILRGERGRPAADIEALADALVAVGGFCVANDTWLDELDINPLLVRPAGKGVVAVDAVMSVRAGDPG